MEREKYPFNIGKFEIVQDCNIPEQKTYTEIIGPVQLGYFKNVKSLCTALKTKIPTNFFPDSFANLQLSINKQQSVNLTALEIYPIIKDEGIKNINEITYDIVRKYGNKHGLSECPWETSLYYVLQHGTRGLNLNNLFSFISSPVNVKGKPSFINILRDSTFMEIRTLPVDQCSYLFNHPSNRLVFVKNE